ncbi:MAG: hypothetical protein WBQ78_10330 [Gammaproteobacteria bacterium]
MAGKPGFILALWLAAAGTCCGDEHATCTDTDYDWHALATDALRTIAGNCRSGAFAELNYHRAYLQDLLGENAAVSGLISYPAAREPNMESHAVHMLLLEQLAPLYYPSARERAAFLNAEYEIRNEIAELWLRGYGTLATRLSEQRTHNTPAR